MYYYIPLQARMNINALWVQTVTELVFVISLVIKAVFQQVAVRHVKMVKVLGYK
jgi:hypothetical protein